MLDIQQLTIYTWKRSIPYLQIQDIVFEKLMAGEKPEYVSSSDNTPHALYLESYTQLLLGIQEVDFGKIGRKR